LAETEAFRASEGRNASRVQEKENELETSKTDHFPILLVDDEKEILELTRMTLECEGIHNVITLQDSRQLLSRLKEQRVSLIVLDLMMPYVSGIELLPALVSEYPDVPVLIMTASDDLETAVECLKVGAFDYLLKPVEPNRLISAIDKALKLSSLQNQITSLKESLLTGRLDNSDAFSEITTCSKKMRAVFQYVEVISKSRQPVLITGETGVGKELMAHAIHRISGVKGEFVTVNVAGLDDLMFSDTLFGHKKGAFTGADQTREGLIGKAAGGTLFLDEIGDLSAISQVKLLRLLQSEEYYPLGSDILKHTDARIIVATNQDLLKFLEEGKFRKDLYYRLCAYQIQIPPLRERAEDIPLLLNHFMDEAASALNKPRPDPTPELVSELKRLNFPGNIREFKALVFDAVARYNTGPFTLKYFPGLSAQFPLETSISLNLADKGEELLNALFGRFPTLQEIEEFMISTAMKLADGRMGVAASLLGITRQGLHKRIRGEKK
jgi:two-component system, NtrC family, response regulator HydG